VEHFKQKYQLVDIHSMEEYCVVLVTCPTESAARIAAEVLDKRAAACVNTIRGVRSLFWWEGKVDASKESLLLMKTTRTLLKKLERVVKSVHPYEVPEIIALPIVQGNRDYLDWISKESR